MIVLGSRSPRRHELLSAIVPSSEIRTLPPRDGAEPGFDDCHNWSSIDVRLNEIVRLKSAAVSRQLSETEHAAVPVLVADTVIVGVAEDDRLHALGKPPETDGWPDVVRGWFRDFYLRRSHFAATAVRVSLGDTVRETIVKTEVTFDPDTASWIDWYLSTREPLGKAGGYALQGAGSLFVKRIDGSPSNVVGLPVRETAALLRDIRPELFSC